ncbi:PucR family transcriptional regulator [Streptomyces cyaneofuscatus]|uniref:PucR family transcriptional regulator n=1 Tax=Streptomyces cyaneofuscatus TaxID=66883 RepID=UPI00379788E0
MRISPRRRRPQIPRREIQKLYGEAMFTHRPEALGVPTDVRTEFGIHALGPLADATNPSHRMLLETLDTFLAHNGSWARTAGALHLHVNPVHYRIQRVELLTGRDLARPDHKLDLRAALLCR